MKGDVIALSVPVKDSTGSTPIKVLLYDEGKTTNKHIGTIRGGTLAQVLAFKTLELEYFNNDYLKEEF